MTKSVMLKHNLTNVTCVVRVVEVARLRPIINLYARDQNVKLELLVDRKHTSSKRAILPREIIADISRRSVTFCTLNDYI